MKGDAKAFEELYSGIYKKLYYYALANLGSSEDAADAVQDAVLDAFDSIGGLKNAAAFDSWLFSILSARIKRKQAEYVQGRNFGAELGEGKENDLPAEDGAFSQCEIVEGFSQLEEKQRLCLSLYTIGGYRTGEIAEMTGLRPSTVRSLISRGRKKLREILDIKKEVKK